MGSEAGFFEAFYASPIQHPILLWLAALAAGVWCFTRSGLAPSVLRYCGILTVLSLADAWLTSSPVPTLGSLPEWAAGAVPLFFVLAGDYRYLLLIHGATADGGFAPSTRHFAQAAGLTLIVPVFSQGVLWALPESMSGARVLFLVYELCFVGLVTVLMLRHPTLRSLPWLASVSRFVLLYYGLWASADILILAGADFGFGLRVIPNLLYYGGLIAVIGAASQRARVSRG